MKAPVADERRGDVAILRLARPEVLNAMDEELLGALEAAVAAVAGDDGVRAVVLTGAGPAFSGGGDLGWVAKHPRGAGAAVDLLAGILHNAILGIRRMEKPVIAAVNGPAAGAGMSLAMACDLRVMARSARFVLAYPSRGLSPDGGATYWLPRLVGLARALELAALDVPVSAQQALAWGLATHVVEDEAVVEEAARIAARLAAGSVAAFGAAKRLLGESLGATLEAQLDLERRTLAACAAAPDGAEGIAAFVAKRPPDFRRAKPAEKAEPKAGARGRARRPRRGE